MLPVKTPKVPASASKDLKNGNGDNKKDSKLDDQTNKECLDPPLLSTLGKNTTTNSPASINAQAKSSANSTLSSNKLASKLQKR